MAIRTTETVTSLASQLVGVATYKFAARLDEAPRVVNCQTLIAWAYGQCGIVVPNLLSEQLYAGILVPQIEEARPGDFVFSKGRAWNYVDTDRALRGVGHVGLIVSHDTVLHASFKARTVVKEPVSVFVGDQDRFRGVYRLPHP